MSRPSPPPSRRSCGGTRPCAPRSAMSKASRSRSSIRRFPSNLDAVRDTYLILLSLHLKGVLYVEAFTSALTEVVRQRVAFRPTFGDVEGKPFPVIHRPVPVDLPVVEVAGSEEARLRMA